MGVCLGEIYQSTVAKRRLIGAGEAGIAWLLRRCSVIVQIDFYMIKNENNTKEVCIQTNKHFIINSSINVITCK